MAVLTTATTRWDQLTAVTFTDLQGNAQTLSFAYDALGQLLEEQSAAGSLQHHYDELGNLIQTQLPDGRWVNRLYYGSGHLHQINLDGQVISDFERDRLHRDFTTPDPIGLAGGLNFYSDRGYTGVTKTPGGGLDYSESNALYNKKPGVNPIVKIEYTGDYGKDFEAANKAAKLSQKNNAGRSCLASLG